ncbi:hypothetical protein RHGRI_023594 [Rhododendron griersonianum]|uniref:Uncharacterized protein n=1 Tax=Rhododendron griersonianum TaxID=479676 RepID=A0AAV6J479_9ERIC|nr:hypothetical protein RHGRI_023594 [Rhododendron griersonianum]
MVMVLTTLFVRIVKQGKYDKIGNTGEWYTLVNVDGQREVVAFSKSRSTKNLRYHMHDGFITKYNQILPTGGAKIWDLKKDMEAWIYRMVYYSFLHFSNEHNIKCWFMKKITLFDDDEFLVLVVELYGTSGGHAGWSRVAVSLRQEVSVSLDVLYVRDGSLEVFGVWIRQLWAFPFRRSLTWRFWVDWSAFGWAGAPIIWFGGAATGDGSSVIYDDEGVGDGGSGDGGWELGHGGSGHGCRRRAARRRRSAPRRAGEEEEEQAASRRSRRCDGEEEEEQAASRRCDGDGRWVAMATRSLSLFVLKLWGGGGDGRWVAMFVAVRSEIVGERRRREVGGDGESLFVLKFWGEGGLGGRVLY